MFLQDVYICLNLTKVLTVSVDEQVVMMGAAKVGKSSLISQFLYGTFSDKYKRTVEEMHQVQKKFENNQNRNPIFYKP